MSRGSESDGVGVACEGKDLDTGDIGESVIKTGSLAEDGEGIGACATDDGIGLEASLCIKGDAIALVPTDDGEDAGTLSRGSESDGVGVACEGKNLDTGDIGESVIKTGNLAEDGEGITSC